MRRFQVVLHFPRPGLAERRRLWQLALPAQAPKADDIDIEVLQQLDLTGAGIVNAARTAALLAAQEDDARIGMKHLISAVDRQFQHEARVLPTAQLGRFARLAESAA
jgi:SpoVK/Ycf46/Vps4 family AAA+-type ATPase